MLGHEVLHQADLAAYYAQLQGRNRTWVCSPESMALGHTLGGRSQAISPLKEDTVSAGGVTQNQEAAPFAVGASGDEKSKGRHERKPPDQVRSVLHLGAKQEDYFTYVKGGDIVSFDVYPVAGIDKPNGADYLWKTAKPFLERWMEEQVGLGGLEARLKREALQWSFLLPQLPRLVHGALTRHQDADRLIDEVRALRREQQMTNRWYAAATVLLLIVVGLAGWAVMRA